MKLLLDTHVAIWSVFSPKRIRPESRELPLDPENLLFFSVASLWELNIKYALGKAEFEVEPRLLRGALLDRGDGELLFNHEHAFAVRNLSPIHRDPFDRLLIAQAAIEGAVLVTADDVVTRYPGAIVRV